MCRLLLYYEDFLLVLLNYEGKASNTNLLIVRCDVFSLLGICLWNFQFGKERWSTLIHRKMNSPWWEAVLT